MPTDYYQGLEDTKEQESPKSPSETDTTLVPKSLVGDVDVGAIVKLKVEHIYEDEVEVSLVSESDEDDEDETEDESEMPGMMSSNEEIDMMAKG